MVRKVFDPFIKGGLGRRCAVIIFGLGILSAWSSGFAQQLPCTFPVNVIAPDLTQLPKDKADAILAKWKEESSAKKGAAPRGDSDWNWHNDNSVSWLSGTGSADWDVVSKLRADAFIARAKKHLVRVESATLDDSPRRVIFVVENGEAVAAGARKAESAVVSEIISKARPEDSFGLLTARGPRIELRLGSDRDALRSAAAGLGNPSRKKVKGQAVLDTVLEASTWFRPPQLGDSVVVMTMNLEGRHEVGFSSLRRALASAHIRVFAFQLGSYLHYLGPPGPGGDIGETSYSVKAFELARSTGGIAFLEEIGAPGLPTSRQLDILERHADLMYRAVTQCYFLRLDPVGPQTVIALGAEARSQLPLARVLYPRYLQACSTTPGSLGH
jgi:hypothetical protein